MPAAQTQKKQPNGLRKSTAKSAAPAVARSSPSAYEIMAGRIANRVAELAENYTFVERPKPQPAQAPDYNNLEELLAKLPSKKQPRKLEIRLPNNGQNDVAFSAPFLDNTLGKMLELQNRMLQVGSDLAKNENIDEATKKEQFAQSAELSRIIALICAEKARQGA
ncbi:uncharacterized protein K452DRAFT_281239 [Aplosporella prunicola CBS 121167]|uniref:Uncharacterized protein n=1 Tax=Aplosporella prunicola CBS 121167 TaxID=1176127 RepID=A0A6A6AVC9_9PEZI|nr:uncharacterized protein K452DRAFT_281239 [Aplosporella prunicola CBS 121167]KAF2135630.1 hypothetical protein K452DRAFT_281239 [Aplosporella prunicola CBS 121167]